MGGIGFTLRKRDLSFYNLSQGEDYEPGTIDKTQIQHHTQAPRMGTLIKARLLESRREKEVDEEAPPCSKVLSARALLIFVLQELQTAVL